MQSQNRITLQQQLPPHNQHQFTVQNPSAKLIEINNANMTAVKKIGDFSYALSDKIGLGLTSNVFKGKNDLTGAQVAIKVIDLQSQDNLSQELLNEEIATLGKIKEQPSHHLLKLEGVIKSKNHLYIITEFCEGKDMMKILKQKKALSEEQAQTVMKQMIEGYYYLYSMGIIHRDLKLPNLFVTNGKVKLADFGFAIREDRCNLSLGYNVGSPKYMPPECLKYNKYSFKSDAWAMGIIAFKLVYGHAPFQNKIEAQLYDQILNTPIQKLFNPNVPVSNQYKNFIVQCLKVDLSQRAGPDFIFNYQWPLAQNFVQGFEEEVKVPEVIKIPGNNYAVYTSNKDISYESKKMDADDFVIDTKNATQASIVSQLQYCRFLVNIYGHLGSLKNPQLKTLMQEIALTVLIKMKVLGEIAVTSKNRFQTDDFKEYINGPDWQNLKQVIVRYDIEFRQQLTGEPPARKNSIIPQGSLLPQTISVLKNNLNENWRIVDKLLTYLEIRSVDCNSSPLDFSRNVNIKAAAHDAEIPSSKFNSEQMVGRVAQRLHTMGF